jgi:hypothetical protein
MPSGSGLDRRGALLAHPARGFLVAEAVMSAQDYRINAEVRRTLVSRWIDVSALQIGTTNGVVYLLGTFEPLVENALQLSGQTQENDPARHVQRLIQLVEKDLRRIRGVRDLVFNLRNARKRGGSWTILGSGIR